MTKHRVLFVDDEPNILHGYQRQLRKEFQLDIAQGGSEGLEKINTQGPYPVVVADMQMPEMNGVQFLSQVKELSPDTVRIMLTGNADQQTATDAVNEGCIFRFLNKPCPPGTLTQALLAGIEQHRLITAERDLLSKTLGGSVGLLTEVLSFVNPLAFGRAARVKGLVQKICDALHVDNGWEVTIAAMLSQVGCVTVPEQTLAAFYNGGELSADELATCRNHAKVGRDLVAKIPRMEGVAEIISRQHERFVDAAASSDDAQEARLALGANILKVALDLDTLTSAGQAPSDALAVLRERAGWYDPRIITVLAALLNMKHVVREVTVSQLTDGMILDDHVVTLAGEVLIASGQPVAPTMRDRLTHFSCTSRGVREPIRVRCPIVHNATLTASTQTEATQTRARATESAH